MKRILQKTAFMPFGNKIYGFDVETYGQKNTFYCASIYYNERKKWHFKDKRKLIKFLKTKRFQKAYIVASNLAFDFYALFDGEPELQQFLPIYRSSSLLSCKTYISSGDFSIRKNRQNDRPLIFIDTFNFARLSVKKLGRIIGIRKLRNPKFLGKIPKNQVQENYLRNYNMVDSMISKRALEFMFDSFSSLGASPKITIAATALSLFKNKYLKEHMFYGHTIGQINKQFKAYYGGRVEAFCRGQIKDYFYYDFNSLYPAVMLNPVPNPNTIRSSMKNTLFYINNFEGIADVTVHCPEMKYPLLPYRDDTGKLLFPTGTFRGWYSNIELRKAVELGYTVIQVHENQYYKETMTLFREYVEDLYKLRLGYKADKSPMEFIVKLLLNSLYGKFAQKFQEQYELLPTSLSLEEIQKYEHIERVGAFFRVRLKEEYCEPAMFCFPIWSLYITAYARLKLHEYILKTSPVYVDTDSLITKEKIRDSKELGELKLEKFVEHGIIVKPKFYMVTEDGRSDVRIKGVGTRLTAMMFHDILIKSHIRYSKFMKFKESLRRRMTVNEIIEMTKELSLDDNKRTWPGAFNRDEIQDSIPIKLPKKLKRGQD